MLRWFWSPVKISTFFFLSNSNNPNVTVGRFSKSTQAWDKNAGRKGDKLLWICEETDRWKIKSLLNLRVSGQKALAALLVCIAGSELSWCERTRRAGLHFHPDNPCAYGPHKIRENSTQDGVRWVHRGTGNCGDVGRTPGVVKAYQWGRKGGKVLQ